MKTICNRQFKIEQQQYFNNNILLQGVPFCRQRGGGQVLKWQFRPIPACKTIFQLFHKDFLIQIQRDSNKAAKCAAQPQKSPCL
jgi:hypothetical protein